MSADLLKIISVFLLSSVKFGLGGVPAAIAAGFDFFKAITVTVSGGITGAFVFTFLSEWILKGFQRLRAKLFGEPRKKKLFTRMNRLIVFVKIKFGLIGLAIITPSILSLPLGCFLAVRYYHNKQQILLYMSVSVVIWALILYFFYDYLHGLFFK